MKKFKFSIASLGVMAYLSFAAPAYAQWQAQPPIYIQGTTVGAPIIGGMESWNVNFYGSEGEIDCQTMPPGGVADVTVNISYGFKWVGDPAQETPLVVNATAVLVGTGPLGLMLVGGAASGPNLNYRTAPAANPYNTVVTGKNINAGTPPSLAVQFTCTLEADAQTFSNAPSGADANTTIFFSNPQ